MAVFKVCYQPSSIVQISVYCVRTCRFHDLATTKRKSASTFTIPRLSNTESIANLHAQKNKYTLNY